MKRSTKVIMAVWFVSAKLAISCASALLPYHGLRVKVWMGSSMTRCRGEPNQRPLPAELAHVCSAAAADGSIDGGCCQGKASGISVPCSWLQTAITNPLVFSNHLLPCFFTFGLDQAATRKSFTLGEQI